VIASSQFITNPFARAGNPAPTPPQMQQFGSPPGDRELLTVAQPYAQNYLTATILSLKNILDWMSGDADLIATSAKILGEANLTYTSVDKPVFKADESEEEIRKKDEEYRMSRERLQNKIQWSLTLGLPLVFALLGVWRYQARRKRREAPPVRRVRKETKPAATKKAA
jgi:hypothetical protein